MSGSPGHGHAHRHAHGAGSLGPLLAALAATLAFGVVEAVAGWLAGSLALLADAGHMASDAVSLGLAAAAAWIARLPPSARHSYGFGRAEVIAALVNALLMIAVVAGIAWEAWLRLASPREIAGGVVAAVALAGLAVNAGVALVLARGERSMNLRGALLHVMGDLLGSAAALVAGLVIVFTGWTPIDPLLSILIAGLVLASSLRLLREALHALMDGVPDALSLPQVGRALAAVPGVRSVHDLHVWNLDARRIAASAHVVVDDLGRWDETLHRLNEVAERFGISHATFQPEPVARAVAWKGPP